MAGKIAELFGYPPDSPASAAIVARREYYCPFLRDTCTKLLSESAGAGPRRSFPSGVCTITCGGRDVICCPNRLYAGDYAVLSDVAVRAFGEGVRLVHPSCLDGAAHDGRDVVVFGKRWGKELRLPRRSGSGSYAVDWVLVLLDESLALREFVAVEVQSIDTTGNYRQERAAYMAGAGFAGSSTVGLNWENVSKRILPQLIYKGNVLQQESQCNKGLFFICPAAVLQRVVDRLGGPLPPYPPQLGSLTFLAYDLAREVSPALPRSLTLHATCETLVHQVAQRFVLPPNLPDRNVYAAAIEKALASLPRSDG